MAITLYGHQQRFVNSAPNKYGVFHATGTGKTITGLYTAYDRVESCLIICPKGVKTKWMAQNFPVDKRYYVITKEEFRRDWDRLPSYQGIIIDEAHHFSGLKSKMHKSLMAYIKKYTVQYVWPMTATPYRREPWNIYALAKILGHDWNYTTFRSHFYYEQYFGPRVVWLPKKGMEQEVARLVNDIGDTVSFDQCGDLPPIQHVIETFDLTLEQKKAMANLELTEPNPLTYYLRQHQVCSGVGCTSKKYDYILDLAETTKKMAIFCRYTDQINDLHALLLEQKYTVFVINGETKDKTDTAEMAEETEKCILLMQIDSAEGFELPSFSTIVFASLSYSYLSYEQALGRFIRINKNNTPKLFIYLLANHSIDKAVYKNLMAKQDFSVAIYANEHHG